MAVTQRLYKNYLYIHTFKLKRKKYVKTHNIKTSKLHLKK